MEDFQRKLISDPDWQKTMDISFGEELQYPLSVLMAKKLIKIYFPTYLVFNYSSDTSIISVSSPNTRSGKLAFIVHHLIRGL